MSIEMKKTQTKKFALEKWAEKLTKEWEENSWNNQIREIAWWKNEEKLCSDEKEHETEE